MPETTTGTETGQTTQELVAPTIETPPPTTGDTPAPRMFTEAEVAAARRKAERERDDLSKQLNELNKWKQQVEEERAAAADAEKSEIQKAQERAQKAEQAATIAEGQRAVAVHRALVAGVATQMGVRLPARLLDLVEGDDADTVTESINNLVAELAPLAPQPETVVPSVDVGAPGTPGTRPPAPPPGPTQMDAERVKRLQDLQNQYNHPRADKPSILAEIAKLTGYTSK